MLTHPPPRFGKTLCNMLRKNAFGQNAVTKLWYDGLLPGGIGVCHFPREVISSLVGGGFGKIHAKTIGSVLHDHLFVEDSEASQTALALMKRLTAVTKDPKEFSRAAVSLFTQGAIKDNIVAMVEAGADKIKSQRTALSKGMAANPKWLGALARLDGVDESLFTAMQLKTELMYLDDQGSVPWLVTMRLSAWRWGPSAVPLPGVACLLTPVGDSDIWVQAFAAAPLLESGVTPKDLASFLETPSGTTYEHESTVVHVEQGQVLYLPFGWFMAPFAFDDKAILKKALELDSSKPSKGKLAPERTCADFWCVPLFSKEWASEVDANVWTSIGAFNKVHLDKKVGDRLWTARQACFDKFLKVLK
jgi:hypothetical protein